MNLNLILLVVLIAIMFISLILFGYITLGIYDNDTETGETIFKNSSSLCYIELGIHLVVLIVASFLFIKS